MENKLKTIRQSKNYSQEKLAKKSGISHATIIAIESGRTSPNLYTMRSIARGLEMPIWEVFIDDM